ncbi:hypothetical protein CKO15_12365 [Halorhodospira abdelmalekii]|nr:hypothetical protein [Halorhodospira abdelmalekii]
MCPLLKVGLQPMMSHLLDVALPAKDSDEFTASLIDCAGTGKDLIGYSDQCRHLAWVYPYAREIADEIEALPSMGVAMNVGHAPASKVGPSDPGIAPIVRLQRISEALAVPLVAVFEDFPNSHPVLHTVAK